MRFAYLITRPRVRLYLHARKNRDNWARNFHVNSETTSLWLPIKNCFQRLLFQLTFQRSQRHSLVRGLGNYFVVTPSEFQISNVHQFVFRYGNFISSYVKELDRNTKWTLLEKLSPSPLDAKSYAIIWVNEDKYSKRFAASRRMTGRAPLAYPLSSLVNESRQVVQSCSLCECFT